MLALLVNTATILVGSLIGLIVKRKINSKITDAIMIGIGVLFAGIPIILYEGILILFSATLSPVLGDSVISAFSCMGAILTLAIGTNVAGVTKFKVVNYIPSLIIAPVLAYLISLF